MLPPKVSVKRERKTREEARRNIRTDGAKLISSDSEPPSPPFSFNQNRNRKQEKVKVKVKVLATGQSWRARARLPVFFLCSFSFLFVHVIKAMSRSRPELTYCSRQMLGILIDPIHLTAVSLLPSPAVNFFNSFLKLSVSPTPSPPSSIHTSRVRSFISSHLLQPRL